MAIPRGSRVYIDTMIWIYYVITTGHGLAPYCEKLLKDIESGNITGVVSTFTLGEIVGVAKKVLAERQHRNPNTQEVEKIIQAVEKEIENLGIEVHDADILAEGEWQGSRLFERADELLLDSSSTLGSDGKWRSLGGADALHLVFAERAVVDYLATCDQGFKGISSSVSPAIVWEEYVL